MVYIKSKSFHSSKKSSEIILLNLLIFIFVIVLGFVYLFQTNQLISYAYQIRQQKINLKNLHQTNQSLKLEIIHLQSPGNLEEKASELGLVKVERPLYLSQEKEVAFRK